MHERRNTREGIRRASSQACEKSSVTFVSATTFRCRLPRKHARHARRIMNVILHRIQVMISAYFSPVLEEILSARCLCNVSASGPALPFIEKTNGVNVSCATFHDMILIFDFSLFENSCG